MTVRLRTSRPRRARDLGCGTGQDRSGSEIDRERRAAADLAVDRQRAAMAVDDVLDDGEAQPGSAELTRAAGVDAVEPLGQARQVLARDAVALVRDADGDKGCGPLAH